MWSWQKYLKIMKRLQKLFDKLKEVNAKDPATNVASYRNASLIFLEDKSIVKFMGLLTENEREDFRKTLPLFLWSLDFMFEDLD